MAGAKTLRVSDGDLMTWLKKNVTGTATNPRAVQATAVAGATPWVDARGKAYVGWEVKAKTLALGIAVEASDDGGVTSRQIDLSLNVAIGAWLFLERRVHHDFYRLRLSVAPEFPVVGSAWND